MWPLTRFSRSTRGAAANPVVPPTPAAHSHLSQRTSMQRRLLKWFSQNARTLPWRKTSDPYAIWVSEVMLQQTQVATVIPFFVRFTGAFPTLDALAAADEEAVLRLWQGLGYYRRARDLHRSARILARLPGSRFPDNPDLLRTLPGFGRYTVNAVLSQAFDRCLPILETNSARVLCRLLGIRVDPKSAAVVRQLWDAAEALLPTRRVGAFNQALMELGALVCTHTHPTCSTCPLSKNCKAQIEGTQDLIPLRSKAARCEQIQETALVLRKGTKLFVAQRPVSGRWAGLWEMPHTPLENNETARQTARRLLVSLGFRGRLDAELSTIRHTVTRFRITMISIEAHCSGGRFRSSFYQRGKWLEPAELTSLPLSSPQRRLANVVIGQQRANST